LVDRRGIVTHVVVGDSGKLLLPDLGRSRAGARRFRGLRLLSSDLSRSGLNRDDLTDLSLLRLDLVAAIGVGEDGLPARLEYATLLPPHALPPEQAGERHPWRKEGPIRVHDIVEDFSQLIDALEGEFAAARTVEETADERPRTILVGVEQQHDRDIDRRMGELERLADTAGLHVIDQIVQRRHKIDPRTLIGKGKLEDLLIRSMYLEADLLVFDRDLNPSQGRTISERTELKVIDRTQLILDIFAQHAHSPDGRVQVELAQLKYLLPRLRQMAASLSRLAGGIGGRGPGETKLEVRSRHARDRITALQKQLKTLAKKRKLRRAQRQRSGVPVAALVGYTNAGKSTLLNALTKSDVIAEDKLFATLDTTSRRMRFPDAREVVITDTVGFIEHLPKDLMKAFEATLEELHDASLLIHVIDASDPYRAMHMEVVSDVVAALGLSHLPVQLVLNKADLVPADQIAAIQRETGGLPVSALEREGLMPLMTCIERHLWREGHGDTRPEWRQAAEI
jgi:GTPase